MKIILCLLLLFSTPMANAGVYRWVAPDGSVHYSDEPRAGAIEIPMPVFPPPLPRPYYLPPPPLPQAQPDVAGEPAVRAYKQFAIINPRNGETILDNQGNVEVSFAIEPELDKKGEHSIQLLLDGVTQGDPAPSLTQMLQGVTRGRHTIAAQVIDKQGKGLIRSRPVSFYMRRQSPMFHPPRQDVPYSGVQQAPRAPMAPRAPRAPHAPFRPAQIPAPSPTPAPPPLVPTK
jgi:hypothetical protein